MRRDADLKGVMLSEMKRGKRPLDIDLIRERRAKVLRFLRSATEEEFRIAIEALGLIEGTAEFELALEAWREFRE